MMMICKLEQKLSIQLEQINYSCSEAYGNGAFDKNIKYQKYKKYF